jgi:hypothetical protein
MKNKLHHYFKKKVEMKSRGTTYKGVFVGADEDYVYLKGETTWITIPIDDVTSIRKEGDPEENWIHKEIAGEPKPDDKSRTGKKMYPQREFDNIHMENASNEWPEPDE